MSVGPFGVAVGVGLGVGAKSGVGETVGVGVGDELCAKVPPVGSKKPATVRSRKQSATATKSGVLFRRNRTIQVMPPYAEWLAIPICAVFGPM
jgi:hypothetical protein